MDSAEKIGGTIWKPIVLRTASSRATLGKLDGLDRERPCSHRGQGLSGMTSLLGPSTGNPVGAVVWGQAGGRARRNQSLEAFGCQDADVSSKSVQKWRPSPQPSSTVCLPVRTVVTQSQPRCPPSAHRVVGTGFRITS